MSLKKPRLIFLILLTVYLSGCALTRVNLLSLKEYSRAELTSFWQVKKANFPKVKTLKALFKIKITAKDHKDFFRGALYYKKPDSLRLERWGMMNQLNGIVYSRADKTIVEVPSQGLFLVGNSKDFAGQFLSEDILLTDLLAILIGHPPLSLSEAPDPRVKGSCLVLRYKDDQLLLGWDSSSGQLIYLAKHKNSGEKIWEAFYAKPRDYQGVKLMSRIEINVFKPRLKIELRIQKLFLNQELKTSLFEADIPADADIEPLKRALEW